MDAVSNGTSVLSYGSRSHALHLRDLLALLLLCIPGSDLVLHSSDASLGFA